MSTLYETIQKDRNNARKAKNQLAVTIFSTVLGNMDLKANVDDAGSKYVSDIAAISVIKKFIQNIQENQSNGITSPEAEYEVEILNKYVPQQMSEAEIEVAFTEAKLQGAQNVGDYMKYLKTNYEGQYDGATASKLAKGR